MTRNLVVTLLSPVIVSFFDPETGQYNKRANSAMNYHLPPTALMSSNTPSTRAFLHDLISKYDWISTFDHSPEFITFMQTNAVPKTFPSSPTEIDLLRNAVASLETHMSRLKTIRRDYRSALSLIRGFPSEILVGILRWTPKEFTKPRSREPFHVRGFDVFRIMDRPWYLGQVCSSWRDAVESLCPENWATLKIDMLGKQIKKDAGHTVSVPFPKKNMVALLECALERSLERRIDFFFRHWRFDESLREEFD
ncbi:uncharacterized protein BT62DRAFT_1011073 [Guyanagaster necrorhizus]|uniref:F-box domain-containing protein n=1 Tax=Guyanagaster necrorhizus TaxID=856835 RepID=A0A9P7VIN6_9AGAR|nr:uncharacterized protein BT62DRAFT_1011073 [Guyanagaster necrorhizus MCA 3950]KAG7441778.1 hypothetical protein BT62DRAFT_1011073 [Guyanagaster necrorhizus MCA 3950]